MTSASVRNGRAAACWMAACLAWGACKEQAAEPTAPPAVATAPTPRPATASCAPGLQSQLAVVESVPMPQRAAPALEALARGCPNVLNALADAAADAAALPLAARQERLRKAAAAVLTPKCVDHAARCPQVLALGASPEAMRDASEGLTLYAAAVRQQLVVRGAWDASAERLVETLLLASALEGEAAARSP